MKRVVAWALLLALVPTYLVAATPTRAEVKQKLDQKRQEKKQLDDKLKRGRQELKLHAKEEKSLVGQIYGINRELEAAKRDQQVHVRNLTLVEDRLAALKQKQTQAGAQEEADRQALRAQLRAVQRSRARQGAVLLFSARTPAQWAARSSALRELSLGTRRKVQGLRLRLDQLEGYRQEYSQREVELSRRQSDAINARQRALREAARRQTLLKEVRQKKASAQSTVASLEESAGHLQDLMDQLAKQAVRAAKTVGKKGTAKVLPTTNGPSTLRGRCPWPIQGRLLSRFGKQRHPVLNVNVFNRGIEIAAAYGSPIKAIAKGTVEYVGEMPEFGRLVVLDHGGGLKSVYGYGSQTLVAPGQAVAQGDPIAEVGEHGAAGQPALYFQISLKARPQDPLHYLSRR